MFENASANGTTVYGSAVSNGQLVPELTPTQIFPSNAYVPYYAGKGAYTPTLPPGIQFLNAGGSGPSTASGMSGYGGDSGASAAADPFNPVKSPVIWAIGFLVIGILGLRHVHWRG